MDVAIISEFFGSFGDWLRENGSELLANAVFQIVVFVLGVLASWFLVLRNRLKALSRLKNGDSDDVIFQANFLWPVPGSKDVVLFFRNVAPTTTVDELYDNVAARDLVRKLAQDTTLKNPVLQTEHSMGFEVLNDAFGHLAGHLALSPFERETCLFVMTCEDRQVVRKKCIRCFLIRPADLTKLADWDWCRRHVRCEQPWHWYRIVALHQIALQWLDEREVEDRTMRKATSSPMVDEQLVHKRVRLMSAGISPGEKPVGEPAEVPWQELESDLKRLGLDLSSGPADGSALV